MKKYLKITAVVALMFAAMTSMANEPKINLVPGNVAKSLILELDPQSGKLDVKLTDKNENTLYSESILNSSYTKEFDLKKLDAGTYYFSVENPLRSVVFTLNVKNGEVQITKEDNMYKPIFRKVGDKVYLNLFNAGQEKVAIKVVDSGNREVFRKSIKGELIVSEVFNFEKAFKDSYTFTVKDAKDTYSQNIEIE